MAKPKPAREYVTTSEALEQLPTVLARNLLLIMLADSKRAWTMLDLWSEINKGVELEPAKQVPMHVLWNEMAILSASRLVMPTFHIRGSNLVAN